MSDAIFLRPDFGVKVIEAKMAKAGPAGVAVVKRQLNWAGFEIANRARRIVPHREGILMGSIWNKMAGIGDSIWVEIGAGGPARAYAERIHYDTTLTYSKPGKTHHYIEKPRDELGPKVMARIGKELDGLL